MRKRITILIAMIIIICGLIIFKNGHGHYEIENIFVNSNRIIIKQKNSEKDRLSRFQSLPGLIITDKNKIEELHEILNNVPKASYYCCPQQNAIIYFLNNEKGLETYCVDTNTSKNSVRIFQWSNQYSFIIDKKIWKRYLAQFSPKWNIKKMKRVK